MYEKIKYIMSFWKEEGIYAISFFVYSNESFEYKGFNNIPYFAISYNTERDCRHADMYSEKRWNYAFWRQEEYAIIDSNEPDGLIKNLFKWYEKNGITNIGEEDLLYDDKRRYVGKGPVGHYELLMMVANVAKNLQEEGFIKKQLKKSLPIIIHGLEYAWYDMEATLIGNPHGEADIFLKSMKDV